ncbi:hypothetical protein ACWEQG_01740 [Microbispora sp. NPDC004025]
MPLPTFDTTRRRAHRLLGAAADELRADCRPGAGPNPAQAEAVRTVLDLLGRARAHLDLAARLDDEPTDDHAPPTFGARP